MLYKETVNAETLDLIERLMKDEKLKEFNLVGGTALSLQIGNRISIDIDLFSQKGFDCKVMKEHLESTYQATEIAAHQNSITGFIDGVKIDVMSHQYPLVRDIQEAEGIRMVSLEDIGAMKLNSISGNGTRAKDYMDMYSILEYKNLNELGKAFVTKYPEVSLNMGYQSLTYFNDIDFRTVDKKLMKDYDWNKVIERLQDAVRLPERIFKTLGREHKPSLEQKQTLEQSLKQSPKLENRPKLKKSLKEERDENRSMRIKGRRLGR